MSCCSQPYWPNNIFIFLGLNSLELMKSFIIYFRDCVNGTKNFKCVCSGHLCCGCGLISLSSWFVLWFLICRLVQVLFLSFVLNFRFSNTHFPVTTLRLDLFLGAYLNKFTVWTGHNDMTIQSKEPARLGDSLPAGENTASSWNDVPF